MQPRVRQRIRFIAKSLLVLFVALILVGMAYEQIAKRVDRKKFSQVARSVDIGRSLNIYCSGEGGPAVILDTGGSAPGYENLLLQKASCAVHAGMLVRSSGAGLERSEPR
jgi:hypothetical protein